MRFKYLKPTIFIVIACMQLNLSSCDNKQRNAISKEAKNTKDSEKPTNTYARQQPLDLEYTPKPIDYEEYVNTREIEEGDFVTQHDTILFSDIVIKKKHDRKKSISIKPILAEDGAEHKEIIEGAEIKIQSEID